MQDSFLSFTSQIDYNITVFYTDKLSTEMCCQNFVSIFVCIIHATRLIYMHFSDLSTVAIFYSVNKLWHSLLYPVTVCIVSLIVVRPTNSDGGCSVIMIHNSKMYQWLNIAAEWFWLVIRIRESRDSNLSCAIGCRHSGYGRLLSVCPS